METKCEMLDILDWFIAFSPVPITDEGRKKETRFIRVQYLTSFNDSDTMMTFTL